MAKNKIITSQGNVQFINSKGKTISMHPMHCYAVYQDDTVSFLFIYMKEYSGQAFFASQFEDLEVDGETYDSIDALKEAIAEAFAKAGAQARTEIVDELPETGYTNTIYLVKKEHGEGYDEYIYNEEKGWQLIGDTDIEFEKYLEKTEFYDYSAATEVKINYISGVVDDNASDIQFISGAVSTEISNREAADAVISGAVDTLSTNLSNEVQRAQNAEQTLQNNINTANARIDAEQIARASADNAISGAVDSVVSDLASEVSRATAKENEIDSKVDGEISAREAADSVISGAVDSLSANLSLEVQRAQNAESALDSKVNALSGAVDNKQDTLIAGENITISGNVISASGGGVDSGVVETMIEDYMTTELPETLFDTKFIYANDASLFAYNGFRTTNIQFADEFDKKAKIIPYNNDTSRIRVNGYSTFFIINSAYVNAIPSILKDSTPRWIKINQLVDKPTKATDLIPSWRHNAGAIESNYVAWSEVSGDTYYCLAQNAGAFDLEYTSDYDFDFNSYGFADQYTILLSGKESDKYPYQNLLGEYIFYYSKYDQETFIDEGYFSPVVANFSGTTVGTYDSNNKYIDGKVNDMVDKTYAIEDLMADSALSTTSKNPVQNKVITSALYGKQDTLVSGTNIKTINNTSILGSGNIDIQGGSDINVVQTTGTSTTDVMSQNAVRMALNNKQNSGNYWNLDAEPIRLTEATAIINPNIQTSDIKIYGYDYNNRNFDNLYEFKYINGNPIFRHKYGMEPEVESYGNLSLVETSAITTSVTSSSTDAQVPSAKAVYDALQEGGGSSYTAGRGIDITNDTISFNLPISAGTGTNSIAEGENTTASSYGCHAEGHNTTASGNYSHAEGVETSASYYCCHAEGHNTTASGQSSHAEGDNTTASGNYCHAEGYNTTASGNYCHAEGFETIATNESEHASGKYNVSNTGSTTADKTLFSVGNGTPIKRHNAFEVRQNGDIYCSDGTNDVKLQDTITATASNTTALGGLSLVKLTQAEYDALVTKDSNTLYIISD